MAQTKYVVMGNSIHYVRVESPARPTFKQRREMRRLHRKVKNWAATNLLPLEYNAFRKGLMTRDYNICMQMLRGGLQSGCYATDFQRDVEWPLWLANFDRGFRGR